MKRQNVYPERHSYQARASRCSIRFVHREVELFRGVLTGVRRQWKVSRDGESLLGSFAKMLE